MRMDSLIPSVYHAPIRMEGRLTLTSVSSFPADGGEFTIILGGIVSDVSVCSAVLLWRSDISLLILS